MFPHEFLADELPTACARRRTSNCKCCERRRKMQPEQLDKMSRDEFSKWVANRNYTDVCRMLTSTGIVLPNFWKHGKIAYENWWALHVYVSLHAWSFLPRSVDVRTAVATGTSARDGPPRGLGPGQRQRTTRHDASTQTEGCSTGFAALQNPKCSTCSHLPREEHVAQHGVVDGTTPQRLG